MKLVSNMLSSTRTQTYMHTEYLQPLDPLPSLDAKKSPLALLAQTCSSIGKPDPPHNNVDTKSGYEIQSGKHSPEKTNSGADDKCSSFKPYKQAEKREGDATIMKIGFPTNTRKTTSPPMCEPKSIRSGSSSPTLKPKAVSPIPSSRSTPDKEHSLHTGCDVREGLLKAVTTPLPALGLSTTHNQVYKHGHLSPTAAVVPCGCHSQIIGHIPCDPLSHKHYHDGQISPTLPYAAAYARVKTADGATTLMPICRDPYCTNCQQAQQMNSSSCTQCRHDPIGVGLSGAIPVALPFGGAIPAYPLPTSAASYLYTPHPPMHASPGDHVCNWVSGTTSCGKRFATSEELLQHLRSHTNETSPLAAASLSAQLGAYYMQYHPSLGLTKSGHVSPLSPVRYHPYRSSLSSPIGTFPTIPAGAYYSPYALHDLKTRFATGIPH